MTVTPARMDGYHDVCGSRGGANSRFKVSNLKTITADAGGKQG